MCKYKQTSDKFDHGNFIRHKRTEHPVLAKARGLLKEEAEIQAENRKSSKTQLWKLVPIVCVEWEGLQLILQPICEALKLQIDPFRDNARSEWQVSLPKYCHSDTAWVTHFGDQYSVFRT